MLKNIVKLEHKIADKLYTFILDNDSPLEHVKEVLFQFQKYIGQIEDQVKSQKEAQATVPSPVVLETESQSKVEPLPPQE